jgi:hypothetical protein
MIARRTSCCRVSGLSGDEFVEGAIEVEDGPRFAPRRWRFSLDRKGGARVEPPSFGLRHLP